MHGQEPMILEGIPVYPLERRRMDLAVPPAPPPMKASEIKPLIPLTQPPPREAADPRPSSVEGP
jgi:hypothetical protein